MCIYFYFLTPVSENCVDDIIWHKSYKILLLFVSEEVINRIIALTKEQGDAIDGKVCNYITKMCFILNYLDHELNKLIHIVIKQTKMSSPIFKDTAFLQPFFDASTRFSQKA